MKYMVLTDTNEYIRYERKTRKVILEVYRGGRWQSDPELSGVFSGDEPIRYPTEDETNAIQKLV